MLADEERRFPLTQSETPLILSTDLQILFTVTFVAMRGVSSVTPALPTMSEELHITPQKAGLLITVYTLPGLASPLFGLLADRFGRKKILTPSLIIFSLTGSMIAFVRDFKLMMVLRFFQGLGAAPLVSLSVTVIGDLYSGEERKTALGYNVSIQSIGNAVFPTISGAVTVFGWYYPFLLPLIALPVAICVFFLMRTPELERENDLKAHLQEFWQLLRSSQVVTLFLLTIVTFILLFGAFLTYFPFLLSESFGASSFTIGLIVASMSLTMIGIASNIGKFTNSDSELIVLQVAFLLYTLALLSIPLVPRLFLFSILTITFGIAQGLNMLTRQTLLLKSAEKKHRGMMMTMNGAFVKLGQSLGPYSWG
ncbi:MAG: MFS transporter [Candidatus Korarchaeota archaeon]|nr:MFS transporter [Candidatus Korarchaeota archaeon]NIU82232.1 MFS transporter [Candidatus Thorarchaeota archaeon]NIW12695.1 MFS transporter [Candidatus Thorarchaeota archaeon]NIW50902.1 MFS transporter [Candidatus Korarchaeota archaeon]